MVKHTCLLKKQVNVCGSRHAHLTASQRGGTWEEADGLRPKMHPALIPEKHPLCGKYMEALVQCRKENPYRKFFGVCSEITYDLSACLKKEKKLVREPRQKRYHERWAQKRRDDEERMQNLQEERRAAAATATASGSAGAVGVSEIGQEA